MKCLKCCARNVVSTDFGMTLKCILCQNCCSSRFWHDSEMYLVHEMSEMLCQKCCFSRFQAKLADPCKWSCNSWQTMPNCLFSVRNVRRPLVFAFQCRSWRTRQQPGATKCGSSEVECDNIKALRTHTTRRKQWALKEDLGSCGVCCAKAVKWCDCELSEHHFVRYTLCSRCPCPANWLHAVLGFDKK